MRITTASRLLLCAVSSTIAAAATAGQVFLYDGKATVRPTTLATIDAETARLILAQRLDLSQFHTISGADEEAIRHVNAFGGQTQQLFTNAHDESRSRVMIVVEGVQDPLSMCMIWSLYPRPS
jgi:hypothetical protein